MTSNIESQMADIIVDQLGGTREQLVPETSFIDDLGAGSLDLVELVMAMEDTFDVEIPDDDAAKLQTIGDAISYLKQKESYQCPVTNALNSTSMV